MEKKIKVGVFGGGRGRIMMRYCVENANAELVAVCEKNPMLVEKCKKLTKKAKNEVAFFDNFDEFLEKGGMDAVVLANYANEHAPYAIRCLNKGLHVFSEVLPVETLKEGVELVEAVEKSGKIYAYAENYCFFSTTSEMKRLIKDGSLGTFEYGEGEYLHNCRQSWPRLTANNDPTHWRNLMSSFFYCTHSVGPMLHISGQRPIKVSGTEGMYNQRMKDMQAQGTSMAVEIVTLESGAIFKSIHGVGPTDSSIWYKVSGSKGKAETAREYAGLVLNPLNKLYTLTGENEKKAFTKRRIYRPKMCRKARSYGHSGSDWYTMHNFIEKIKGNDSDIVDVYEALDMFFVGHFGYLSALNNGVAVDIPNFRDPEVRENYRNDTACCNPQKAGEQLLPSRNK